jgi:hypothetical protein
MKHQTSKHDQVQARHSSRKPLIITHHPSETGGPGERTLHHPSARQQDTAALSFGQLDHVQADAMLFGRLLRFVAGIASIHVGQFHMLSGDFLHGGGQFPNLSAILLVGWRHQKRKQVPQRIDGHMDLAALAPLGPIIASPVPAFRRRGPRAAIKDRGAGMALAPFDSTQQEAQIMDDSRKSASGQPALRRLLDDVPGRQVMGHHPPARSCAHDPAQAVQHFSQLIVSLPGIFGQQRQIRGHKGPFIVGHIRRIRFSGRHATILPSL